MKKRYSIIIITFLISLIISGCAEKKVEPDNKHLFDKLTAEKAFEDLDKEIKKLGN